MKHRGQGPGLGECLGERVRAASRRPVLILYYYYESYSLFILTFNCLRVLHELGAASTAIQRLFDADALIEDELWICVVTSSLVGGHKLVGHLVTCCMGVHVPPSDQL